MNILFVCGVFDKGDQEEVFERSKIFPYMAANVHQYCIASGLGALEGVNVELLSTPFVGTYPREYTKFYLPYKNWSLKDLYVFQKGGINLFGVRTIWRTFSVINGINKWYKIHKNSGEKNIVILYSMITPFLWGAGIAKNLHKSIKLCLYVPDLPVHFVNNARRGGVYRVLKQLDCKIMNNQLCKIDCFALLAGAMNEQVNKYCAKHTVIEGIVSKEDIEAQGKIFPVKGKIKHIVYTGKADVEFNVPELARAFSLLDRQDVVLDIYGDGNAMQILQDLAQKDSRIKIHGTVLRQVAMQAQKQAYILVNPRTPEGEYTKYSFPSKTIEYMLASRPVVMHKLEGILDEYDKYLNYFKGVSLQAMADTLAKMLDILPSELDEMGKKGRDFIIFEKNEYKQALKLKKELEDI